MNDTEFETLIKEQDFIASDFIESSYNFWFQDSEHIRTPFPEKYQADLKKKSFRVFMEWVFELSNDEKSELSKEEIVEIFEMILFNQAMEMVDDEDQKITICYPFLPRLGDAVEDKARGTSTVVERKLELNKNEKKYMKVKLLAKKDSQEWETEFELPA